MPYDLCEDDATLELLEMVMAEQGQSHQAELKLGPGRTNGRVSQRYLSHFLFVCAQGSHRSKSMTVEGQKRRR